MFVFTANVSHARSLWFHTIFVNTCPPQKQHIQVCINKPPQEIKNIHYHIFTTGRPWLHPFGKQVRLILTSACLEKRQLGTVSFKVG